MPVILPSTESWRPSETERAVPRESLLVFADDWGRHPSSCQHLIRQLLDEHEVVWVNTIGTRTPKLNWSTIKRGFEKIRHWSKKRVVAGPQPTNLRVLNPKMWPSFGPRFGRALNRKLLLKQLTPVIESLASAPVAVSTIPLVSELMGILPVRRWVYYCVDDFSQWPGLDQSTMQEMEQQLVERADAVVAVSEVLQERLLRMGRTSQLLTHGVDLKFWSQSSGPSERLRELERPLVAFWGVLDRRMDTEYLTALARKMTRGTIVLAGPEEEHDPAIDQLSRIHRLGSLPFEQLPSLAGEAAVLVMPYADLPVTRAIQPLKLKEYLATGKPVVVRDLPATRSWSDALDLADSPAAFAAAVSRRIETGLPPNQRAARKRLAEESWQDKAKAFQAWIFGAESGSLA